MTAFVGRMFNKKTFEKDFALVTQVDGVRGKNITMPDGIRSVLSRRRCWQPRVFQCGLHVTFLQCS